MTTAMAIIMVLMVVGFIGFGRHHGTRGGHDKEEKKEESVMPDHGNDSHSPDLPAESVPEKENGNE